MEGLIETHGNMGDNGISGAWKIAINGILDAYIGKDIH
jgi:hypothetical protein